MVRCHLPPRGVGIPRSFNSRAMALMETKPALRSLRIVEPRLSARMSAARLFPNPSLILAPLGSPRRLSILTTVLRCHLPPAAPGIGSQGCLKCGNELISWNGPRDYIEFRLEKE